MVNENNDNPTCRSLGSEPIRSVLVLRPNLIGGAFILNLDNTCKLMGQGLMKEIETFEFVNIVGRKRPGVAV